MAENLKTGDKVEWETPQGKTFGMVKKLTAPVDIKKHHVAVQIKIPNFLSQAALATRRRRTNRML